MSTYAKGTSVSVDRSLGEIRTMLKRAGASSFVTVDEDQLHMLRHMLGINVTDRANPNEYRDYAACNPGDERMLALEASGLVRCYRRDTEGLDWWTTTEAGKAVARESQRARLMPKPKRVYRAFLRTSDCDHDLTFKQFITDPEFAEARDV